MPTKHCNGCNQDRDIEDFNLKDRTKATRQASCRFCIAAYGREHYKNNKQAYIDKARVETNGLVRRIEQSFLHICLSIHALIAVKLTRMFLSLTMYGGRNQKISLRW
jgi:hypothetical protein